MKSLSQEELARHLSDDLHRKAAHRELLLRDVTIDEDFLGKFPILTNVDIYDQLRCTLTKITISGVSEPNLGRLLQTFRTVQFLVLHRVDILRPSLANPVKDPEPHTSLKLSNCKIHRDFLCFWFTKMQSTLRTVHLDRLKCDFLRTGQLDFLNPLVNITALSVEGMTLEQFDIGYRATKLELLTIVNIEAAIIRFGRPMNKLQFLKIDATCPIMCSLTLPALKHLWLRCPERAWPLFMQEPVRTLQLHNAPVKIAKILRLPALEKVKISCNWYDADRLRRHFDRLTTIKSCVISNNSPPEPNKCTISKLNNDCWRCILSFLPVQRDIFNLSRVVPAIFALQNSNMTLRIDPAFLKSNQGSWTRVPYKKSLALNTTQLSFMHMESWAKVMECLPYFVNLVRLELHGLKVKPTLSEIRLIPRIKELKISNTYFTGDTLRLILSHLETSLRTLHVADYDHIFEYLMGLKQIQRLTIEKVNLSNDMFIGAFLKQNRNLEHVTFKTNFSMITLKPLLAWLSPSLKTLNISGTNFDLLNGNIPEFIHPFPNLEELSLKTAHVLDVSDVRVLRKLPKLTTFRVYGVLTENVIMALLQNIPTLLHLHFDLLPSLPLIFEVDLRQWLRHSGRIVYFHGGGE